jgi:ABC-type Fe3+/spermidine/putrescine transport system ATPase subunit
VALARALVKKPRVLLLDEPLSALDAKLRETMQMELVRLQQTVGITFIIVTHDQNEALSMANRIAVMNQGEVLQVATPAELYEFPQDRFVAEFIGKMNLFEGTNAGWESGRLTLLVNGLGRIELPCPERISEDIGLAVRPEKMVLLEQRPDDSFLAFEAEVEKIAYYGSESRVFLATERGLPLEVSVRNDRREAAGVAISGKLWVAWRPGDTLILPD